MALALPATGKIVTLDKHEEWAKIAKIYWKMAGVTSKIELKLGLAHESLDKLSGPFDMVFIDADKQRYKLYYDCAMKLLRPGGLMVFDNTLWKGDVANPGNQEETPTYLRNFNAMLRDDERIHPLLFPITDGMTLGLKL